VSGNLLQSGQQYKAVVTCVNNANLTTTQTSEPFIVDKTSPTTPGQINAGVSRDATTQYQSDTKSISMTWPPFTDAESPIKEYWLTIGTTALDDDIVALHSVGLRTQVVYSGLSLLNETKYYITVYGVNAAGLNISAQGLPLFIDGTPPVAVDGSVMDGVGNDDWEYFNPNEPVSGHWEKIYDPGSGISKSTYCLGRYMIMLCSITSSNIATFAG